SRNARGNPTCPGGRSMREIGKNDALPHSHATVGAASCHGPPVRGSGILPRKARACGNSGQGCPSHGMVNNRLKKVAKKV
ncbi:MAG: hypothetical protein KC931_10980, partial [Candidatus Omnitrophica bacterium]|nr:hypothetical protein [Candidatus Omnitrophota bacterium]